MKFSLSDVFGGIFRRRIPAAEQPQPAPIYRGLDTAVTALIEADGTQSRQMFDNLTLPLIRALGAEARRRGDVNAEQAVLSLIDDMTAACKKARDTRMPRGRPGTDYRRYETHYNYALITAMAVAWHMDQSDEDGGHLYFAEKLIPFDGLRRMKEQVMVWSDWQAFFTGEDDGGLRWLAGREHKSEATGKCAEISDPARKDCANYLTREQIERDSKFVTPNPQVYAGEDALGWEIVHFIRDSLRNGTLTRNRRNSWVQVDREGRTFLQAPELFDWCRRNMPSPETTKCLQNRFGRLNICVRYRNKGNLMRGARPSDKRFRTGLVVADPAIFWDGYPPDERFAIQGLTPTNAAKDQPEPLK